MSICIAIIKFPKYTFEIKKYFIFTPPSCYCITFNKYVKWTEKISYTYCITSGKETLEFSCQNSAKKKISLLILI